NASRKRPGRPPIREIVTAYIDGLVDTVVAEPELRSFIMRSIRSEDRGLVDNALVASCACGRRCWWATWGSKSPPMSSPS
ncbi:MAG: hypothetical protein WAT32_06430, partial [Candidatus Microthrix parvicella]